MYHDLGPVVAYDRDEFEEVAALLRPEEENLPVVLVTHRQGVLDRMTDVVVADAVLRADV